VNRSHSPQSQHLSLGTRHWLPLIGLLLFAFALRLYHLDTQPIWWDEAMSTHLSTSSVMEIVHNRAGNLHPPLYFFLLKGWVKLVGTSSFSVRFLSAWFSTLLIPALYAFGRRWLSRRSGWIATGLAAVFPLYLVYAQEARVYAILPLAYVMLLDMLRRMSRPDHRPGWGLWLLVAGIEALALGLHYMSLFAVSYVFVILLVRLNRNHTQRVRLLVVQGLVILSLLPWFVAVFLHVDALAARLEMSNWRAEPVTAAHYLRLLWTFQLTGLTALIANPTTVALTVLVALVTMGAVARALASRNSRQSIASLLLDWLVPLGSACVAWQIRPLSHPRYVLIFTPALVLLFASVLDELLDRSRLEQGLAALLALALVATSALGIFFYHAPRFAKDDTRGTAAALAVHSTANDLILVPPEDWSVPYYYDGSSQVEMIWPDDSPGDWRQLASLTEGTRTVFLVDYYRATRDPRTIIPFALESAGSQSERWGFKGLYVRVYHLDRSVEQPMLDAADADIGLLRLTGAWVEPSPAADTALTVALRWHLEEPTSDQYRVSLRLRDIDGWELAAEDDWLLDDRALPSDRWAAGQAATTYHVLPLVPGTPPLTYTLSLGVYTTDEEEGIMRPLDLLDEAGNPRGQSYEIGTVALAPARSLESDPYGVAPDLPPVAAPAALANGLLLEAAALDRQAVAPGQSVFVTLRWQAADAPLPDLRPVVRLEQAGNTLVTADGAPAGGRYPTDRWAMGEVVMEHRRLTVPPTATDGPAAVAVELGDRRIALGSVEIAAGKHTFTVPPMAHELHVRFGGSPDAPDQAVAELLGYDLAPGPYTSDRPISLTLYWHACEGASGGDYTVFTHLLADDGHLVAQHDGLPAGGSRPTLGWIPGEIVVDRHEMTFRETYAGAARIEVGLYDTITLERVLAEDGQTFAMLPAALDILKH